MNILAIDPGNIESAYCIINAETYEPIEFNKEKNEDLLKRVYCVDYDIAVIEMVSSYGMPVGIEVFETVFWIGRFYEKAQQDTDKREVNRIFRKDVKLNLCNSARAKDSNITQALIDRFAKTKTGKGTKKEPDWFYGFYKDIWQAYALGVTYLDLHKDKI